MSEPNTIARPYAKAAFEFAVEKQQLEQWSNMLTLLSLIFSDKSIQGLLDDPKVSNQQLVELAVDIAKDQLNEYGNNFLKLLSENNRLGLLPLIHQQFEHLKDEYLKLVEVDVTSAFELSEELQQKLAAALEKKFYCKVKLNTVIDPSVIGGALIRIGDKVIDGTVLSQLTILKNHINTQERLCQ